MNRKSIVRQTQLRTQSVGEGTPNPQNDVDLRENASVMSSEANFEASTIDDERANERDCGVCNRPNKAEWFMVQCGDCGMWYHFSCAGVTHKTVHSKPFSCASCAPRPIPAATSITERTSTSSSRKAKLVRDMQRHEEERALEEKIQQATLKKLEREREYIARKYEILEQQDEADMSSVHSGRSSRTSRVKEWLLDQNNAVEVPSAVTDGPVVEDVENSHVGTLVNRDNVQVTSTPLKTGFCAIGTNQKGGESRPASSIGGVADSDMEKTFGSITINGNGRPTKAGVTENVLPLVDVQSLADLLEITSPKVPEKGARPKNPIPFYEKWRRETEDLRKEHIVRQQQHENEIEVRRKRELELVGKLNQLKGCKEEQFELQRRREADLLRQLQLREEEGAEFKKQQQKELNERDEELQRLRKIEQAFRVMQMSSQQKQIDAHNRDGASDDAMRPQVCTQTEYANNIPIQTTPLVSVPHLSTVSMDSIDTPSNTPYHRNELDESSMATPMGGRSQYSIHTNQSLPMFNHFPADQHKPLSNLPMFPPYVTPQYEPWPPFVYPRPSVENYGPLSVQFGPSPQQVAARQVISKELPSFTGDPIEWPMFICNYMHSTSACGYTDSENLLRLQRCLKGTAKDAVSSLLLHPSSVPQIISTLQTLYGRPEQIVNNMVSKVRSAPAPKADRLDTWVTFGLMVQNLCGHLRAVGLEYHLSNPILLQELVEKLPPTVKFNWALYQQSLPTVDLKSFGDYMEKVATATSSVSTSLIHQPMTSRDERARGKDKAFVNRPGEVVHLE